MPDITLTITMNSSGQVQVSGPIDQRLVCYGLLEIARDVIAEHNAKAGQLVVQPATALHFGPVNGGHRG